MIQSIEYAIEEFKKIRDGDISAFTNGECGDFAIAMGKVFPVRYCEIHTDSFAGIHYFVEHEGQCFDAIGNHIGHEDVINNLEYYSQDYNNEEVKWKYVQKEDILGYSEEYANLLADELRRTLNGKIFNKQISLIKNNEVVNLTPEGESIQKISSGQILTFMLDKYEFGFQDGGCLMYASMVSNLLKKMGIHNEIKSIGRQGNNDHFIVNLNSKYGDVFIDSDGLFNTTELKNKMYQFEFFNLLPSPDDIVIEDYKSPPSDIIHDLEVVKDMEIICSQEYQDILFNLTDNIALYLQEQENARQSSNLINLN